MYRIKLSETVYWKFTKEQFDELEDCTITYTDTKDKVKAKKFTTDFMYGSGLIIAPLLAFRKEDDND